MKPHTTLTPYILQEARIIVILAMICMLIHFIMPFYPYSLILLLLSMYIVWSMVRCYRVLQWINSEMQEKQPPITYGLLGAIAHLTFHYRNIDKTFQKQQKNSHQILTGILSALPSATVILNNQNEIEWANYSASLLLGIDTQQDIGIKVDTLLRQSKFIKKLNTRDAKGFEMVSPIDEKITLLIQFTRYAHNKYLLLAHNISAHIENQRSKKTFIANASHELRTPLTIISGYLEFIQSTPELPASLNIPIEKSIQQSQYMNALIDDLLLLSQLENKPLTASSLVTIDLQQQLHDIIQAFEESGKLDTHHVSHTVEERLIIQAVPKELDSICYNLLSNALKYSDTGTAIHLSWEALDNNKVKLAVSDQGVGIAPEHLAHLTERFYRVDSGRSRKVGGTGLGLSITKHIVERHNGHIEITSHLGKGSTFSVILPVKQQNVMSSSV